MFLKIIASIFTGIGGHYLNRRLDKAILFLCLFIFYLIAAYTFFIFSLTNLSHSSNEIVQEIDDTYRLLAIVSSSGIFILWLASLIITIFDCKNKTEPNLTKWTKSGIVGAILTSILSIIILSVTVVSLISLSKNQIVDSSDTTYDIESSNFYYENFYEYLYLGGSPSNSQSLPSPPIGDGVLKGKISYQNNPAKDVTLDVVLNSKFIAKDVVTDSNGIFSISLPLGAWTINSIQTKKWPDRPKEGNYSIYYGGEEKLTGNEYNRFAYFDNSGYLVNVSTDTNVIHFNITIAKDIQLTWPSPNTENVKATLEDTIRWEKYPEASRYYVEIKKIKREGTTTHYETITSKILSNETSIPLKNLKHIKTIEKEDIEYGVEILAFSDSGTLIAEFADTHRGGTFLLSDGYILVEDKLDAEFGLTFIEDPDELQKKLQAISMNNRRVAAVEVLIEDSMLPAAETLLSLVDSEYSQGEKEVLLGYLMALQGECEISEEMFEKALSINPDVCIPNSYKDICE